MDIISIFMLKLCGFRKEKPLEVIFENCLKEWAFPNECKKTNVVPVHRIVKKKNNKEQILWKIFERLIWGKVFKNGPSKIF